jgi:predicted metal-dependent HD superfamily phosphohydrolase
MDACIANADGRLETLAQLIKAYAEPHRHYHNLQHIVSMLDVLPLRGLGSKQPETLKLAAWYHDVVYDPRSAENESRSASVARASLSALGIRNDRIERTCALILMTKDHKADDGDPDAELFLDADLSILRSPSHAYDAYARAIREEYAWVPDRDYCDGRIKVLRGFLQRPKVFRSARTMEAHESQARINITTEIARLERKLEMSAP